MINKIKSWLNTLFSPQAFLEPSEDMGLMVVIITGASKGIGKAVAELLYKKGANLVLVSRNREAAPHFPDSKRIINVSADVSSEGDCQKIIDIALEKFGKIDCLINNAGMFIDKSIDRTTSYDFRKIIDVNLISVFNMTKKAIVVMKSQNRGTIINIGSKISHNTNVSPNKVAYATSKYAVEGFSFALNKELKGTGVRVTCLMPGTTTTFLSKKGKDYLSPYEVAQMVKIIIDMKHIDFESIVFKSINQNI